MSSSNSSPSPSGLFLGIDVSTQSCKLTIINGLKKILTQVTVNYDHDLPQYHTRGGVIRGSYGLDKSHSSTPDLDHTITTPSLLFVNAFELGLERLKATGLPIHRIVSVSVSGQQHGSVYWKKDSEQLLHHLTPESSLTHQLAHAFSIPNGPIWMDSSTHNECVALEHAIGGPQKLAELTGSRAYERFTGNQIAKIAKLLPHEYKDTERISLVSSMIPSLLLGSYASIDASDGAGMNLMNLNPILLPFEFDEDCLASVAAHAPGGVEALTKKLGSIVDPPTLLGRVHSYFVKKYGFSENCEVVAGSGDNPCSLVGMNLEHAGDIGVSLGTSDTLFFVVPTSNCRPNGEVGHVFPNPIDALATRMVMLCMKNGSLAREAVRNSLRPAHEPSPDPDPSLSATPFSPTGDPTNRWTHFNHALERTQPIDLKGNYFIAFPESEITPATRRGGFFTFLEHGKAPAEFLSPGEFHALGSRHANENLRARGVIESQFLNMRLYATKLGLTIPPKRLVVTGGASINKFIIQILADVFGCDVEGQNIIDDRTNESLGRVSDTASLGAALRALHSHTLRHEYELSALAAASPTTAHETEEKLEFITSPSGSPLSPGSTKTVEQFSPAHIGRTKLVTFNPDHFQYYSAILPEFEANLATCVQLLNQPNQEVEEDDDEV